MTTTTATHLPDHARGFAADGSERIPTFTVTPPPPPARKRRWPWRATVSSLSWPTRRPGRRRQLPGPPARLRGQRAQSFADRSAHDDALACAPGRRWPGPRTARSGGLEDDTDGNGSSDPRGGFAPRRHPRWAARTWNSVATGPAAQAGGRLRRPRGFVVAWQDDQGATATSRSGAGLPSHGLERIADFSRPPGPGGQHVNPTSPWRPTAPFVIGWQDDADATGPTRIRARAFSAPGREKAEFTPQRSRRGTRMPARASAGAAGVRLGDDWTQRGLPIIAGGTTSLVLGGGRLADHSRGRREPDRRAPDPMQERKQPLAPLA
jgi:hypothetical protein